jgi:hypothetical protein
MSCINYKAPPCEISPVNGFKYFLTNLSSVEEFRILEYRVIHTSVKHLKKFAVNKKRNGHQILLHRKTDNLTKFVFTCVHLWLYGRHLYGNPVYPTRVSAHHDRPEPQERWYCCFLAANHGSSARGLPLKNTLRVYFSISVRIIMALFVVYSLQIF